MEESDRNWLLWQSVFTSHLEPQPNDSSRCRPPRYAGLTLNGLSTRAPVGSKWFTLRVTTVRLCTSAVAAIKLSMPLLPVCAHSLPHNFAMAGVTGRMLRANCSSIVANHCASLSANSGLLPRWRSMPASTSPMVSAHAAHLLCVKTVSQRTGFASFLIATCAYWTCANGQRQAIFALEVESLVSPAKRSNDFPSGGAISTSHANIAQKHPEHRINSTAQMGCIDNAPWTHDGNPASPWRR